MPHSPTVSPGPKTASRSSNSGGRRDASGPGLPFGTEMEPLASGGRR